MSRLVPLRGRSGAPAARQLFAAAAPRWPALHFFDAEEGSAAGGGDVRKADEGGGGLGGRHVLLADGSRIFAIDAEVEALLQRALRAEGGSWGSAAAVDAALARLGLWAPPFVDDSPLVDPPVRALSLAVAQKCNLGCTYCYAQEGSFGEAPRDMELETALAAVELLVAEAGPGDRLNLAFLGGEPLINRALIRAATEGAVVRAADKGATITFSITTNGTLITPEDGAFFERHGFAVTISLDGIGAPHDQQRPTKGGKGSYATILERVRPLLAQQRAMQVSARVTVTPANLALRETLDELVALGFHSVGFSPMLSSPTGRGELRAPDLEVMLEAMVGCGREFERRVLAGERYPFSNMTTALRELARGTHRPYPCGAGAGYLGVAAGGELSACHRFVGDPEGALGDVAGGPDRARQRQWLDARHVHRQEPCRSCWARYLCGGGCHHEVLHRGRPACDYIRGWLHYCLGAYVRLSDARPGAFGPGSLGAGSIGAGLAAGVGAGLGAGGAAGLAAGGLG